LAKLISLLFSRIEGKCEKIFKACFQETSASSEEEEEKK